MRMFLVGMCDIFLLLYLTAVAQVVPYSESRVTLQDYERLEQQQHDAQALMHSREQELAQRVAELEQARQQQELLQEALRRSQTQLSQEAWERTLERAALSEQLAAESQSTEALVAQVSEAERRSESLMREVENARTEAAALAAQRAEFEAQSSAAVAAAERSQAELSARERQAQQREQVLRVAQEDLQKRLSNAQKALAAARRSEAEANAEARTAGVERILARTAEERAAESARAALERADEAEAREAYARTLAEEAQRAAAAEQERLRSVLQPAERAYEAKVESQLLPLRARVQRLSFLGTTKDESRLWGIPVRFGGDTVIFQPAEHVGLEGTEAPDSFLSAHFELRGRLVQQLYVHPSKPGLIGFGLESFDAAASPPLDGSLLMPVLLAVRNGAQSGFADRIRDLNEQYYLFQRDRLRIGSDGMLSLDMRGIRGTGDFGELILPGDQIVDLEGRLVGVAVRRNVVMPIGDAREWRRISIQGRSASTLIRDMRRTWTQ